MARGWESKSVEDQIDEAERRKAEASRALLSAQETERQSLLLQRGRIVELIEQSANPRFIEHQRKALEFLDEKLELLNPPERSGTSDTASPEP
jgi:hypothetical protein